MKEWTFVGMLKLAAALGIVMSLIALYLGATLPGAVGAALIIVGVLALLASLYFYLKLRSAASAARRALSLVAMALVASQAVGPVIAEAVEVITTTPARAGGDPAFRACLEFRNRVLVMQYAALILFLSVSLFLIIAFTLGGRVFGTILGGMQDAAVAFFIGLLILLLFIYPLDAGFVVTEQSCVFDIERLKEQGPPLLRLFLNAFDISGLANFG